jgi:hypothetical protein
LKNYPNICTRPNCKEWLSSKSLGLRGSLPSRLAGNRVLAKKLLIAAPPKGGHGWLGHGKAQGFRALKGRSLAPKLLI